MTLETQIPRVSIVGNGTLGPYNLNDENGQAIRFVSTSHVKLTRYATTTSETGTVLVLNTDFSVGGTQDARTFTLIGSQAVLTSSQRIIAERNQTYVQDLDLTTGGPYNAESQESRHDKVAEYLQEVKTLLARKVEASPFDSTPPTIPLKANVTEGDILVADSSKNWQPVAPTDVGIDALLLGSGWTTVLALPSAGILDNLAGIRFVSTYAALTALTTAAGLSDNSIYCTYGRAAEEDGGFGFWRYDSGSSATANGGTVLAIDGGGAGRFFRLGVTAMDWRWFGAVADNATNCKSAYDAAYAAAAAANLPLYLGSGRYNISTDLAQMVVTDQTDILIYGDGVDLCYIRFSDSATKGLDFSSTTTTANALPRFEVHGVTLTTSAENIGPAIKAEWAIDGDIEDPVGIHDIAIQGDIRELADDGSDYGYWSGLIQVVNARNSNIRNFRLIGEMDRASNKTAYAIKLEGECTSFRIQNGYISECETGVWIIDTTEGVYLHNVDMVAVLDGVYYNITSGAEPQFTFAQGHINALRYGIRLKNVQQFAIADSLIYAKKGWSADNPSYNHTAIYIEGALAAYGEVSEVTFSKESGQGAAHDGTANWTNGGSGSATTTAVDCQAGTNYVIRGTVFGFSGDTYDYGVRFRSGVVNSFAQLSQTIYVDTDYDYTAADGNLILRNNDGELQVIGGSNQFFAIIGTAAAYLKLYDSGGGSNQKEVRWYNDGGVTSLVLVNDDGSTKHTPVVCDDGGTWRAGADSTYAFGADSIRHLVGYFDNLELRPGASRTPVNNGDLSIEATNNTTLTFKFKGSDGTVRSGTVTLS